ncbi:right-handed parallel beta-helix repeat-containing protein, partial [Candidatus Bathyarchaeota archaeon]|nr:right-handed parallel beta-helix repeat-containing protein [Candidatus Bathyarchaeota archaeon]
NISENNMSASTFGMWLTHSSDNEVIGNDFSNLGWSLLIYYSHNNTVQYNNISFTVDGVRMMFSRQNNFTENHFESNSHSGIFFWQNNTNNRITKNRFYSNQHGVELKLWCNNNTIADNDIRHNERNGILILESTSNMVTRNYVYSNARGVISYDSSDNKIYHNSIIDSWEEQAADFNSANIWNNGCEGNYWSNYSGIDLDGDGIGDTYLPWEDVDYYPLMNLYWNPADVNHDLDVDIFDVVLACSAYSSTPLDPNWNPHCDIAEPYGKVDIYDVVMICNSYGEEYNP